MSRPRKKKAEPAAAPAASPEAGPAGAPGGGARPAASRRARGMVLVVFNVALLLVAGYLLYKNFGVIFYRKKTSDFLQAVQGMQADAGRSGVDGAGNAWMDLRRPHPYCGYRGLPLTIFRNAELGVEAMHNDRGFRSPELGPKQPGALRLAMLGGSAVWAGSSNAATIVARLAGLLERDGLRVEYVNAGVSSAISNQELGILVHDLLDLEVDIVVAFDGYNDIYHYLNYNGRVGWPPMRWDPAGGEDPTFAQAVPAYYPFIRPNPQPDPAEMARVVRNYVFNIVKMEKICAAFKVKFVGILQPYRDYDPSRCPQRGPDFVNDFYCEAEKVFAALRGALPPGVVLSSFAGLLQSRRELFSDPVHFHGAASRDVGNQIVAERIYGLMRENLLVP